MLFLDIMIPGAPRLQTGTHSHWSVRASERKKWRHLVVLAIGNQRPDEPFTHVKCTFIRGSNRRPDDDNLVACLKPVRDGLIDAGVISDDKTSNIDAKYEWAHSPRGKLYTRIIIKVDQV